MDETFRDISVTLRIIAGIQPMCKFHTKSRSYQKVNTAFSVIRSSMYRFITCESRDDTFKYISKSITIATQYAATNEDREEDIVNLIMCLSTGISELRRTYAYDPVSVAEIDCLIQRVERENVEQEIKSNKSGSDSGDDD